MNKIIILLNIAMAVLLVGCGQSSGTDMAETEAFDSALQTAVAETIAAAGSEDPVTPEPPDSFEEEGTDVVSTIPPLPSLTPSQEVPPTDQPTNTPQTPCYRAELVEETVPDGTKFTPGKYFTKIWVIRNTGVCAWNEDFRWVLFEGEDFNAPTDLKLNQVVNPNEDLRVQMELKTPELEGVYTGTYKILTDDGGEVTPIGFWVTVISEKAE
jgi:hypothetical protein